MTAFSFKILSSAQQETADADYVVAMYAKGGSFISNNRCTWDDLASFCSCGQSRTKYVFVKLQRSSQSQPQSSSGTSATAAERALKLWDTQQRERALTSFISAYFSVPHLIRDVGGDGDCFYRCLAFFKYFYLSASRLLYLRIYSHNIFS